MAKKETKEVNNVDNDEQLRKELFIALSPQINIDHPRAYTQKVISAIDVIIEEKNNLSKKK